MPTKNCTKSSSGPAEQDTRAQVLHDLLSSAVADTTAEGILLSGGLDTSIVATLAASQGRKLHAFTVCVADAPSPDELFARLMAERLGLKQQVLRPTLSELVNYMPAVIQQLATFDPMELTNSIVTSLGLEAARAHGVKAVLTGDAADELFAGYSFLFNAPAEELPHHIRHMNRIMRFTSVPLGTALGVKAELPFAARAVRDFAVTLTATNLVGERDGQRYGKKILREAFAAELPPEITWRAKMPIEHGSGSTALRQVVTEQISEDEFRHAREQVEREDGVRLRDRQQCFYYQLYRRCFPPPREQTPSAKSCPECRGPAARQDTRFCRICGAYPI